MEKNLSNNEEIKKKTLDSREVKDKDGTKHNEELFPDSSEKETDKIFLPKERIWLNYMLRKRGIRYGVISMAIIGTIAGTLWRVRDVLHG